MSKQLTMKAGVALFAVLALAGALAIFAFGAYQPVAAQTAATVTRSFDMEQVIPGGTLDVTITHTAQGIASVDVTETLPTGWTFDSIVSPSGLNSTQSGRMISFSVPTITPVTYRVMAPSMVGDGHVFSGTFTGSGGATGGVVGDTTVNVATAGSTPSEISSLAVNPTSAKPGEAVTVTGMGLPANATAHIFIEDMKVTSATISDSGSFAAAFIVPDGALGGRNTVAARASASATENMATATLMVEPDFRGFYYMAMDGLKVMSINNDVSNTIYADIRGFGAGNVMFTAMGADGESVTLGSGSGQRVALTIGAGALAAGNAAITATQGDLSDMMSLMVVTPAITLSDAPADNSMAFDVTVTGTDFGPGSTVSITADAEGVATSSASLTNGSFAGTITLPAGTAAGEITITATSGAYGAMNSFMLSQATPAQVMGVMVRPGEGSLAVTWTQVQAMTGAEVRPAASGYKVEWKMVSAAAWDAEDMAMVVGNDQTYHLISGLTPGQPYMVRVSAMTGGTAGMVSGINSDAVGTPWALPVGLTVPGLVQNMDVSAISNTELFVSWNAPENNGGSAITGYSVQYRKFGATSWTDVTRAGAGVGQEIAKLEDDTAYQVQVAAMNSAGAGPYAKDTGRTDAAPAVVTSLDNTLPKSFEAVSSDTPGAAVRVTLKAKLAVALDGEIAVKLDKFGLPTSIDKDEVTIRSNDGTLHYQGNPTGVTVSGSTVTLTLGTLKGLTDSTKTLIDLKSDKVTTITIQQSAGITNPTAANVDGYDLEVGSDKTTNKATVNRKVTVKPTSGARGSEITVTGKGFGTGTATIELGTGDVLESNVAIEDGSFEKVLTVGDDFAAGANTINAVDGAGDRASKDNDAEFMVKAKITADPEEVTPAQEMTIKVSDWSAGAVTEVDVGGIPVKTLSGNTTSASSTKGQFKFTVPAKARVGVNKVTLWVGKEDEGSVNVTVKALELTIDPTTVVPGQRLTITGTDFAKNTNVTLIMIGDEEAELPDMDDRASTSTGRIAYTVAVPLGVGNGDKKVEVTVGAKKGIGAVVVPKPTITVTPEVSAPGTVISVEGSGFASGKRIEVLYDGAIEEVGRADSSGGFTIRMDVPSDAGIGTTNDVKVEVRGTASINATAEHKTPGSMITLPETAQVGARITISGSNFEPFSILREVTVGGTDALPSPAPETDKNGAFSFEIRVPRLTPGNHTITVKDGSNARNSATETFAVVTTPIVSTPAEIFGSLGDILVVVWRYDNATGTWASYDPSLVGLGVNDLTGVSRGDIVWVQTTADYSFQGKSYLAGWNLYSLE